MHDRYALNYDQDAYVKKYGLPQDNPDRFYTDSGIQADFDNRLVRILNYQNPRFGGRKWYEINEAIFSFEAQNEAMGHRNLVNMNWQCDRAKVIKTLLKNGILVTTGGGIDFDTSIKEEYFKCPQIDVISLHTYDYELNKITNRVSQARDMAWSYGKRVIVEEFGAVSDQEHMLLQQIQTVQNLFIPWLFWEIMKPSAGGKDFEIWKDQSVWWTAVNTNAHYSGSLKRGWSWPELWPGDWDDGDW